MLDASATCTAELRINFGEVLAVHLLFSFSVGTAHGNILDHAAKSMGDVSFEVCYNNDSI